MTTQWNKYEATAARKHGKPGREIRPKSTTIDIHSHVAIPQAGAFVKPHLDLSTIPLGHFANAETKALSQKQEEDIRARITTGYDERLADLDAMGLDMQLGDAAAEPVLLHGAARHLGQGLAHGERRAGRIRLAQA